MSQTGQQNSVAYGLMAEAFITLADLNPMSEGVTQRIATLLDHEHWDWNLFVGIAYHHRLAGFTAWRLAGTELHEMLPTLSKRALETAYRTQIHTNLALLRLARDVSGRLREAAIAVVATKGSALLADRLLPMGARETNDCDLLIDRADARAVHDEALRMGFRQLQYDMRTGKTRLEVDLPSGEVLSYAKCRDMQLDAENLDQAHGLVTYCRAGSPEGSRPYELLDVAFDIFWTGTREFTLDVGSIHGEAHQVDLRDVDASLDGHLGVPGAVHQLIHLCLHFYEDAVGLLSVLTRKKACQLGKLLDIAVVSEALSDEQVNELVRSVSQHAVEAPVVRALAEVAEFWPASRAAHALEQISAMTGQRPGDDVGLAGEIKGRWRVSVKERYFGPLGPGAPIDWDGA